MNVVTSRENAYIKELKSLKDKKHRDDKGLFFIEGLRFVEEALKEEIKISRIFVSESFCSGQTERDDAGMLDACGCDVFMLPDRLFKEVADTEAPQGILAVIPKMDQNIESVFKDNSLIVLLDSIQDPGNLGTIIRTADAAGATGVVLSKGCVDVYNPKVLRSTMGSVFHIPVYSSRNFIQTIRYIKSKGIKVFAAYPDGASSCFDADMTKGTAILIGNEANGISPEAASESDELVKIPMQGRAESLNASIASAVFLFEAVRQRMCGF